MRRGYDPGFSVSAAWALEFSPVNVSVVFMQRVGNEHVCIGSRSWFFEPLADCLAEARTGFPWRVAEHILPPEDDPRVWELAFSDQGIFRCEHAPALADAKRMTITQRLLPRLIIDTVPRAWAPGGNNAILVDSLNGYRVKELASHSDVFTLNILATHEQYLSRAVEHYAAHDWRAGRSEWSRPVDYSSYDRAVI